MMYALTLRHKKVSIQNARQVVFTVIFFTAGWAIQWKEIQLGQLLGKGEFGGEQCCC